MKNKSNFKNRRSQITLFVIIGILLLFSIAAFFYYKSVIVQKELEKSLIRTKYLASLKLSINNQVEQCTERLIEEYIFSYGVDLDKINDYVNDNYKGCLDFKDIVNDDDIKIESGISKIDFKVSDDKKKLIFYIDYPVTIDAPYGRMVFNEFVVEYDVEEKVSLKNIANQNIGIKKGFFSFYVEKGTVVTGSDYIELRIVNYPKEINDITLGPVYVDIYPKGVKFDPPGALKVYYKEKGLQDFPEKELKVAYTYQNEWYTYKTEAYPEDNYVIASIDVTR